MEAGGGGRCVCVGGGGGGRMCVCVEGGGGRTETEKGSREKCVDVSTCVCVGGGGGGRVGACVCVCVSVSACARAVCLWRTSALLHVTFQRTRLLISNYGPRTVA